MPKCLVLGANGFLGSHLVDALVHEGYEVRAFDRSTKSNLYNPSSKIETVKGNFLNKDDISTALESVDHLFHFISTTTPITSENDPRIDVETNVRATIELLEMASKKGIKKVVFASTSSLYGGKYGSPVHEDNVPFPVSPYAIGKLTIEHFLRYFNVKFGLKSVTFRISNPYGTRQSPERPQGVIPIFIDNILRDSEITVLGDGTMIRDYIYVPNVASMIAKNFDKNNQKEVYNLGSSKGVSINELIKTIEEATGKKAKISYKEAPKTFTQSIILDTSRLINEFGPLDLTPLKEGISKTIDYVQEFRQKQYGQ